MYKYLHKYRNNLYHIVLIFINLIFSKIHDSKASKKNYILLFIHFKKLILRFTILLKKGHSY